MVKKKFVVAGLVVMAVIGVLTYCNNSDTPSPVTPPAKNGLIGVWSGAAGRQGGGGSGNLDSFGVVFTITDKGYAMGRGNKVWGSSLFTRDSSRDAGTYAVSGKNITFTPDTAHDSCFKKGATSDNWFVCKNYNVGPDFCDCFPPVTIQIDTVGNSWHNVLIENANLAGKFDTLVLTRQ